LLKAPLTQACAVHAALGRCFRTTNAFSLSTARLAQATRALLASAALISLIYSVWTALETAQFWEKKVFVRHVNQALSLLALGAFRAVLSLKIAISMTLTESVNGAKMGLFSPPENAHHGPNNLSQ
jgi:hypothetical protein